MAEKKLTFEQAMSRLEEIVTRMERGDVPLEESMGLFDEGTTLLKKCTAMLDKAEQKVVKLTSGEEGRVTEGPMDGES